MKGQSDFKIQMTVSLTPGVKALLAINGLVWFAAVVIIQGMILQNSFIFNIFGLAPSAFFDELKLWQPLTYMFLHSKSVWHILFNSLIIWFIGSELEKIWGLREFIKYYLVCGVGAGLLYIISMMAAVKWFGVSAGSLAVPTVGASGAVFGLLVAYGFIFSERVIYFMMLFPMKAKHFVLILAGVEVFTILTSGVSGRVNNLAHLGGFIVGLAYLYLQKISRKKKQDRFYKKPGRKLKLVVDNENEKKKGPTFH